MSGGVYESWVIGLRAWANDPGTDLSQLPTLTAESFTPATYQRLIKHLNDAISTMMASWNESLNRAISSARDEHDVARELVQLRALLARRLQLARHPGFPQEISNSLWDGACVDILAIQQSLESGVHATSDRATTSRSDQERTLAMVRGTSFAAIIAPGYPIDQLFSQPDASPAISESSPEGPSLTSPSRRRVVTE